MATERNPAGSLEQPIRLASATDLATVQALTEAAYAPSTELLGAPMLPLTDDYARRIARREVWLLGEPPLALIVLEHARDHLLIVSVAVSPEAQRGGHGQRLLAWADDRARRAKLREIRLYTNARLDRNIAIYARAGFLETGRRPNPHRPGWTLVDMSRAL